MSQYYDELIQRVSEKFGEDNDVKSLIKAFRQETEDEEGRDVFFAKKLEDYVNSCGHDDEKFLVYIRDKTHRYLQSEIMQLVFRAISVLGGEYYTDGRNENCAKQMRKLKQVCKENDIYLGDMFFKL